jgi:hypothetical protein
MSTSDGYEIEINGQKATVVVAHYNALRLLTAALLKIADGNYTTNEAKDVARDAIEYWDMTRKGSPVVLIVMKGGSQT